MNNERYIRIAPPSLHQAAARTARRSRRASTLGMFVASVLVFSGTTYAFSQTPLPQLFSDAIATAFTAPRAYVAAVGTALGTSTAQSGEQGNLVASSTSVAATTPIVGGSVASPASVTQITQPVIERVKETERVITVSGVTLDVLNERLKELDNKLSSMIFAITAVPTLPASGGFTNSIALTNRIDQLRGTTITSPTISGATITNSSITSTSVGATSLSADTAAFGTTTVASLTISGTCTGCGSSDPFTHPSATVSATTSGLLITASSTIGDGSQIGGLTISGGATTTGNAYVAGNVGIGTAAPRWSLHVASSTPYVGITDSDAGADQKHWLLSALDGTFRIGKAEDAAPTATTTVLMIQPESNNFTFGDENFTSNVSGIENISIGGGTLLQNTSGSYNTGIGGSSLQSNISGHQNIALGTEALLANTIGAYNVALGNKAGSNITSGSANIAIGYNALVPSATADRQLSIGNLLFGMLPATTSQTTLSLPTSGTFGIGTSSPFAKFAIHTNNGDTATTLFAIGSSTASATTTFLTVRNTGNVGIGATNPGSKLTVATTSLSSFTGTDPGTLLLLDSGTVTNNFTTLDFGTLSQGYGTSRIASKYTASGSYLQFGTSNAFGSGITNTALTIDPSGSIGIGTTSPYRLLSLTSAVATAQAAIAYDSSNATELLTSSVGDLFTYPSGNDFLINNGNAWVCTGGSGNTNGCPSGAPSGFGNLIVETKIGIASSTPWTMLALGADGAIMTTEKSLTDGATIAIDWKNGNQQLVTLGGNRAITFSNYIPGMTLRLVLCQDGTGSRTITSWPAVVLWSGGSAPTLTTTANKCDIATFLTSSATGTVKVLGSTVQSF